MKYILISFAFFLNSFILFSQDNETIKEIIFKSSSRGGEYSIIIHSDSVFTSLGRTSSRTTMSKFKIKSSDWDSLVASISEYKLIDLIHINSIKHKIEDASFSTIIIVTNKTKYDSGTFYDYNPNQKLSKLMKAIEEIKKTYDKH